MVNYSVGHAVQHANRVCMLIRRACSKEGTLWSDCCHTLRPAFSLLPLYLADSHPVDSTVSYSLHLTPSFLLGASLYGSYLLLTRCLGLCFLLHASYSIVLTFSFLLHGSYSITLHSPSQGAAYFFLHKSHNYERAASGQSAWCLYHPCSLHHILCADISIAGSRPNWPACCCWWHNT